MRILKAMLIIAPLLTAFGAKAQTAPVVVELYTSQGCAYCPPADRILEEIAEIPGVLALALHVTYWDYLGWKDAFGDKRHDLRQRGYAKRDGKHSVYTPQMIVQGIDRVGGAKHEQAMALVAAHQQKALRVLAEVERDGPLLLVRLAPVAVAGVGLSDIYLVRFNDGEVVDIMAGENAGQRVSYSNVVTEWTKLSQWDGRSPVEFTVEAPGRDSAALIVQRDDLGQILTAAIAP
jgi:hypothetical protein